MSEYRDAGIMFEARIAFKRENTREGYVMGLTINITDIKDPAFHDLRAGTRLYIAAVPVDEHEKPLISERKSEGKRAVMSAGMLCKNERFQQWMFLQGMAVEASHEAAIVGLRQELGVKSRSEIAENHEALERFREIRDAFYEDARHQQA